MDNISPVYARFVLREVLRLGFTAERLLQGTTLTRSELESGGDIAMNDFLTILENGRNLSANEQLGLVIGRHTNITALGQIGAAAAIAPTVREGLQVMEHYTRLHITYIRIELSSGLHGLSVRFRYLQDTGDVERFHTETAVMLVQHYVETLTGQALADAQYRLAIKAPGYQAEYANWLHSPVSFDWEYTSAEVPARWLDLPSPYYNADMWKQATLMLARQLRELEGERERPYSQYVTSLMQSCEPPLPDLSSVANRIHMSERTLNRRLQQEGTSFREIKGSILGRWARRHLSNTNQSVEAIAAALGYQDTANFRRAFRNAEGCSPSEFRRQASVAE
jgi:AraC-like DNA-binding protein